VLTRKTHLSDDDKQVIHDFHGKDFYKYLRRLSVLATAMSEVVHSTELVYICTRAMEYLTCPPSQSSESSDNDTSSSG
jgi:hypothetical protein